MPDINPNSYVLIGSSQAIYSCPTWQESSVNGIVTCYSISQGNSFTQCVAEVAPAVDPRTGSQYQLSDSLNNISDFVRDYAYCDLLRYCSTSSGVDNFSLTFPGINLAGNELAVAYAALSLSERGQTFCVMTHSSETNLIKLCEEQKWKYEIVG